MNSYKQQLLELSTELYRRAAKKSKKYQGWAKRMSKGHAKVARNRGDVDVLGRAKEFTAPTDLRLSRSYDELSGEREEQASKFSAAAKGVKTKRPPRGYPLGAQQANLIKQTEIHLKHKKPKEEREREQKYKDKDKDDPADWWKNENLINNFEKSLSRKLMEMRTGPSDTTHDPGEKGWTTDKEGKEIYRTIREPSGRSRRQQQNRDYFASKLKKHRMELRHVKSGGPRGTRGTAERAHGGTVIATDDDIAATGKNLKKMRRKTGRDRMADESPRERAEREFRHVPRGRTATVGGERTDPSQAGEESQTARQLKATGEGETKQQTGVRGPKGRRVQMKKKATKIRARVRKQGQTSYSDLKDPDAAEVAGLRNRPPRDIEEHFQGLLANALILNEIGDTQRGKDAIAKAFLRRKAQVDKATEVTAKSVDKHGLVAGLPDDKTTGKLARAELQMSKVGSYMGGRMHGEEKADELGYKGKQKQAFGDAGAKLGREQYDAEYKEGEKKLTKRAKRGKWGPTGKGTKQAVRDVKARSRSLDWDEGMPPGQSVN
jgi:hypothetical protein